MTFENETGDRGRTWCAWPDWPMTPDYDLAPNPIILRVTKQKWPCRQGGPRIIRGWTGQSRGECRQWQPFGCHQSRSVLITCWFTTKHFFFFLNSINQGYLFIPMCFLEFYAFQNERDDEHLTQFIIRPIPMKAYRIVTDWPIVVLGVMFHILKWHHAKLILHADNYILNKFTIHNMVK